MLHDQMIKYLSFRVDITSKKLEIGKMQQNYKFI